MPQLAACSHLLLSTSQGRLSELCSCCRSCALQGLHGTGSLLHLWHPAHPMARCAAGTNLAMPCATCQDALVAAATITAQTVSVQYIPQRAVRREGSISVLPMGAVGQEEPGLCLTFTWCSWRFDRSPCCFS